NLDEAFQSTIAFRRFIIRAIARAIHSFRALIRCIQEGVACSEIDPPETSREIQFDSLSPCFTEVLKVAESGLFRGHKEDVIAIGCSEPPGVPFHIVFQIPTQAYFKGSGNDLFQRRISGHRVWQLAGLLRICTPQLDRGWRSITLAVS